MLLQMPEFHSFLSLGNISSYILIYTHIYINHIVFVHSSVDGHLRTFCSLASVNNAAMNTGVHVSFQISISVFFIYIPKGGTARSW